ncbi:MAG: iron-containing alcohol dehydrogenase [Rhodobacteraceae bacterium]|nr:iron-containing alcohol dehydrogenase [Paracoccaceae bacterium]
MIGNWSYPTAIRFGPGRIEELPLACREAGISRPLLVTDRGIAGLSITERALSILEESGFGRALFADVGPNPTDRNLNAGIEAFLEGGFDGVVGFGGGSGLDLGKMIAFMAGQSRPVWDFEDIGDYWKRADADAIRPSVAVPTTAGTGSEVGRASVITNTETRVKKIIFHPKVLPKQVICDPELTIGLPPAITAGTGMDAFAHCLEAYCAPGFHPMSQGIAIEGMRLVRKSLRRAYRCPDDLEARADMMSAASMGAVAFQKGLGAIHALSHPAGALFDTHHGTTNAVVMQAVLEFNRPEIESKLALAAAYLGVGDSFAAFSGFAAELHAELELPSGLRDLGVQPEAIDLMTEMALKDPCAGSNPVTMTRETTRRLYQLTI